MESSIGTRNIALSWFRFYSAKFKIHFFHVTAEHSRRWIRAICGTGFEVFCWYFFRNAHDKQFLCLSNFFYGCCGVTSWYLCLPLRTWCVQLWHHWWCNDYNNNNSNKHSNYCHSRWFWKWNFISNIYLLHHTGCYAFHCISGVCVRVSKNAQKEKKFDEKRRTISSIWYSATSLITIVVEKAIATWLFKPEKAHNMWFLKITRIVLSFTCSK